MRKLVIAVTLLVALCVSASAAEEEGWERKTFFDLYSLSVPADWKVQTSVEEYSVTVLSPDEKAFVYVLPPDPDSGATTAEYAEWFLNRYSALIGLNTWGIITEDSETDFNGYPSFMLMVGMPEKDSTVFSFINVFDVDGYQVLQFSFTDKENMEKYMTDIAKIMDSYDVDEDAMKGIEFTLRKKGDYIAKEMNAEE